MGVNYMSNRTFLSIFLTIGLIQNIQLHKMRYFPNLRSVIKNKMKIELYLSNYETKSDLKKRNRC